MNDAEFLQKFLELKKRIKQNNKLLYGSSSVEVKLDKLTGIHPYGVNSYVLYTANKLPRYAEEQRMMHLAHKKFAIEGYNLVLPGGRLTAPTLDRLELALQEVRDKYEQEAKTRIKKIITVQSIIKWIKKLNSSNTL